MRRAIYITVLFGVTVTACGSNSDPSPHKASQDAGIDTTDLDVQSDDAFEASDDSSPDVPADVVEDVVQQDVIQDAADPRFEPIVDSLEKERMKFGAPGVALAIVEGGKLSFSTGLGSKGENNNDPVHDTTLFRIASITKPLTATAVLQLVERGDIDLEQPITTYLPTLDFAKDPSWASSIRIKHLLTHESAIVDALEIDSTRSDDHLKEVMLGPYAENGYLMAPPGRMYNYSNPGYMFAGLVAETVGGDYYRLRMHDEVLLPQGMDRTYFLPSEVLADGDYALGKTVHWTTGQPLTVEPDTYDNAWGRPAGYAWSSVLDLAKFIQFLRDGNDGVLAHSLREEMMKPQVSTKEFLDRLAYGYGLMVQQGAFLGSFYDIKIVQHAGALPGFAADMYWVPDCDLGFITLANTDGAYFISTFVLALQTLCSLPAPTTPPDITVNPSTFTQFEGVFHDPFNVGTMVVTKDGNDLNIELPTLDDLDIPYEHRLTPTLPNNFLFYVQGIPLPLTFLFDDQGQVEYLRTRPFVGKKAEQDGGTPPPPPPIHKLSRNGLLQRFHYSNIERSSVIFRR